MEDKYYTPELSELFVGCEVYIPMDDRKELVCVAIAHPDLTQNLNVHTDYVGSENKFTRTFSVPECLKMKYLDAEDMGELGFKEVGVPNNPFIHTPNGKIEDIRNFKKGDLMVRWFDSHRPYISIEQFMNGIGKWDTLYQGQCKNKFKLKVILKDIGV